MAKCNWCDKEMLDVKTISCTETEVVFPNGEKLPVVHYENDDGLNCHDCNVAPGGAHHPGCDMERCPKCLGQLISCGCLDKEK